MALGVWGAVSGSGGAAGVLLGGLLTSSINWSWIFFINIPVGLAVIGLTPLFVRESKAHLDHRHFDVAGATSITAGLMLLVYALTRATEDGWATASTIALLAASAALIVSFVVIELRSKAPLLPMRIFRLRTLTAANVTGFLVGSALFSQFFLLTLYMQQVLHYSAIETGVAYITLTLAIIIFAGIAQGIVTRVGVRWPMTFGLGLSAAALVLFTRLPVDGHYFWDIFPGFLLSGIGLAFAFVPMTIAALVGVREADAGIASGLINTSQQIGGAVGLAVATTIATTFTGRYVDSHAAVTAGSPAALNYGFEITFYVLAGLAALAAVLAAVLSSPARRQSARPSSPSTRPSERTPRCPSHRTTSTASSSGSEASCSSATFSNGAAPHGRDRGALRRDRARPMAPRRRGAGGAQLAGEQLSEPVRLRGPLGITPGGPAGVLGRDGGDEGRHVGLALAGAALGVLRVGAQHRVPRLRVGERPCACRRLVAELLRRRLRPGLDAADEPARAARRPCGRR